MVFSPLTPRWRRVHERLLLYLLRWRDGVLGRLLVLPLAGHLLAAPDQRVQVDVTGGVNVELGSLAVLEEKKVMFCFQKMHL